MNHRIILLILLSVILNNIARCQSPTAFENTSGTMKGAGALAGNNPWLGAQIGYKFGESDDFSDNLLVSGRFLYEIPFSGLDKFHLPVMGNIGQLKNDLKNEMNIDSVKAKVQQLLISTEGINTGLYPYYVVKESDNLMLTLHGVLSWKINAFNSSSNETTYLQQGRFSLGAEMQLGSSQNGRNRLVLGIAPTISFFNKNTYESIFGSKKSSLPSLEITGVVPIGAGVGLLFEGIVSNDSYSVLRVGILLAAEATK